MKKTIISTLAMMLAMPVFATPDIASNANGNGSCVEPVLHRYDGTANLQAGWQANTIQLKWYNGDTQLDVQDAADSCTYDGELILPETQPTKTGYTFAGWKIREIQQCSLSSLDPTVPATLIAARNSYNCYYSDSNQPLYCADGLDIGQWWGEFSYGKVYGESKCSKKKGTQHAAGTPNDTPGGYCWCSITAYQPSGGEKCNNVSPVWVMENQSDDADGCLSTCAMICAKAVRGSGSGAQADRSLLFGITQ